MRKKNGNGSASLDVDAAVSRRYSRAATTPVAALCSPTAYDPKFLSAIPKEVIDRDYGCGDPTPHLASGDTVLDLGSGSGKIAFIAAQVVGPEGRVIGVDANPSMLAVARRNAPRVARSLGYANVEFRRGRIEDLRLDLDALDAWLRKHSVRDSEGLSRLRAFETRLRETRPLVVEDSVDAVISNCVLNLVRDEAKPALFAEMFRALRKGGRVAISDIVADEDVPSRLKADPDLWSGCVSGAMREDLFLKAFEDAGFYGIRVVAYGEKPWATVEGIEFRSMTIVASKGKQGPCRERNQAVLYRGPWKSVEDDDGHTLRRGVRTAVCDKTYRILTSGPYAPETVAVPPREEIPLEKAKDFDGRRASVRHPRETKGTKYGATAFPAESCCAPGSSCG